MDQPGGNAYELFVQFRNAERAKRQEERMEPMSDDIDRCDCVYRPTSTYDEEDEEFY